MAMIPEAVPPPPTFEQIKATARRNGHVLFFGKRFEVDIDYAVGCTACGAYAAWMDDKKDELYGVFAEVWDKKCGGRTHQ
jgi:hypothetical protein